MHFLTTPDSIYERPCVATIGFFDGVHCGHRFLVKQVTDYAEAHGLDSLLVTFDRHPREVMQHDYRPRLLSTPAEKLALLGATGADVCAILPFTPGLAALTAREFMQQVLHDRLNVRALVIGYDHRFGCGRVDGFDDFVRYGREMGMDVIRAEACRVGEVNVSSSVTRSLLDEGEVALAARCLSRPYDLTGTVVEGFRVGRELGFPTANLQPDDARKLIPARGAYAVRVNVVGADEAPRAGMLNIGCRPTLDNGDGVTLEVHILDFEGDLYGRTLRVEFVERLRGERKFKGRPELVAQLRADAARVRQLLDAPAVN